MKIWSFALLACILFLFQATAIAQSVKLSKEEKKQEKKYIDSLFLVNSLPVRVTVKESLDAKELQQLIEDSLKARKFKCLSIDEAVQLYNEKISEFMGLNDPNRIKELADKISRDKEYINRENEMASPYMQGIVLVPCANGKDSCIGIKNYPNARKERVWEFKKAETETNYDFVRRILNAITPKEIEQ